MPACEPDLLRFLLRSVLRFGDPCPARRAGRDSWVGGAFDPMFCSCGASRRCPAMGRRRGEPAPGAVRHVARDAPSAEAGGDASHPPSCSLQQRVEAKHAMGRQAHRRRDATDAWWEDIDDLPPEARERILDNRGHDEPA